MTTVTSETVFLVNLGSTRRKGHSRGQVVGINQIVWDPETHTLHVESDELLAQHTRYALVVTNGLRDLGGDPVEASEAFAHFRKHLHFGQTTGPRPEGVPQSAARGVGRCQEGGGAAG